PWLLPRLALEQLALAIGLVHGTTALLRIRGGAAIALLLLPVAIELAALGTIAAWQPEFVLLALFLSVYGGVLLPRQIAWLPPLGVWAFFLVFLAAGPLHYVVVFGAPDDAQSWRRIACSFTAITAGMAFLLRRTLELLRSTRETAIATLEAARSERGRLRAVRNAVLAAERQVARAQDGETTARLVSELRRTVDGLLSAIRSRQLELHDGASIERVHRVAREIGQFTEDTGSSVRELLEDWRQARTEGLASEDPEEASDVELVARDPRSYERDDDVALQRALVLSAALYGLALIARLASTQMPAARDLTWEALAFVLVAVGALFARLPGRVRVALLVSGLLIPNAFIVLERSYMAPTSLLGMGAACLCAAVYADRKTTWLVVAACTGVFLVGSLGPLSGHWIDTVVTPSRLANWWRLSLVFPLACFALGRVILDQVDHVVLSLGELDTSLGLLASTRRAVERSTDQLSALESSEAQSQEEVRSVRRGAHDLGNSLSVLLSWSEQLASASSADASSLRQARRVLAETAIEIEARLDDLALGAPAGSKNSATLGATA
ncbi:MAG TPA: hypothetical protein VLC09_03110, partial [Polyangiaceae bacterium]|nr:hypothetical protein [Polyangiaceae bacterium]